MGVWLTKHEFEDQQQRLELDGKQLPACMHELVGDKDLVRSEMEAEVPEQKAPEGPRTDEVATRQLSKTAEDAPGEITARRS